LWQWDVPGLLGGGVRLTPLVGYRRTVNQGYFGLGNASRGDDPRAADGRNYQFIDDETRVREIVRIAVGSGYHLVLAALLRAESPDAYPGSLLARDASRRDADGAPYIRGLRRLEIATPAVGAIYDVRDDEIFPASGAFHQVGVRLAQGMPLDARVQYAAAGGS